ncbi:glycoside hydrolase family 26 protein [Stieleria magnilauensis]
MKNDKRLAMQFVSLVVLAVLPISMIAVNGARAFYGILAEPSGGNRDTGDSMHEDEGTDTIALDLRAAPSGPSADTISAEANAEGEDSLIFGVYDPDGEFERDRSLRLRHVYVSWADFDRSKLRQSLVAMENRGFQILLTIEPWPIAGRGDDLLASILAGGYDETLNDLARILDSLNGPVYVSWGHEMDQDLTERYPWSGSDPDRFVGAYQHVVNFLRRHANTELRFIWAGVLKEGSLRYWPGNEYADYVGMPVYSYPRWDQKTYGFIRDFRTTFEEKAKVVEELDVPLLITELGVSGSSDFEAFWLHQAFMGLRDYESLKGIVFFYAQDVEGAWGSDIATPDWRVHPDSIRGLVEWELRQAASLDARGQNHQSFEASAQLDQNASPPVE